MAQNITENDLVIQSSDMALVNISTLAASGALDLSPRFQRRNRWDRERQSQLIESFLTNVPVPPVYLAEESRGTFAVIDGKQRLTAITEYFDNVYPITDLQLRGELEGTYFRDLPLEVSASLSMRPLRAVTVLRQTPDWVKHQVFIRLNRGGQPLNAQEIRNVAFAGQLNDSIIEASADPFLQRQLKITSPNSPSYADMTDVEFVVRFFAVGESWSRFGGSMRDAMDDFMAKHFKAGRTEVSALIERFKRALRYCEAIWGDRAFQRFDRGQWRDQLIGGMYDAQMVAVDQLPDFILEHVVNNSSNAISHTQRLFTHEDFDQAVRVATNTPSRVQLRVNRVVETLRAI
ncbi:DUF262 domain-containing protein [Frondihabitans australicus]|uniref:Uncharacterized protein DUF262 n=1 Tax=Frondihabitans australicus TaxID=386892 RepID=A0A495IF11_9MICO|nr:DUF262 domain-containing protein [Frondihabitans australicus]RKR73931.1 uncharacterized protein DUF262 [Frondihabitans australicus]